MSKCLATELLHYCHVSVEKCVRMSPHKIEYYDLTFVLEGEMVYSADGSRITLRKNDILFLPPNTVRERFAGTRRVHYVSFNFLADEEVQFPFPVYSPKSVTQEIRTAVLNFPMSHLIPNTHSHEKCLHLLNYILFVLMDQQRIETQNPHVHQMLRFIEAHISEPLSLQRISEEACLSREYASHLFRREMGKTLTDYVVGQKMELAKEMLLGGEMSLSDVASSLGYEDYNYFSRAFKVHFGVSPIRYRNHK